MKKYSRRQFIGTSALVSGSLLLPKFLKAFERNNNELVPDGAKKLVIIQLSGGNDGLNTIIPYRNDVYYSLRPTLAVQPGDVLKLTDEIGFNPAMEGLRKIFDDGNMCILNSVGYPNPDHSHFRSMDIWHTASGSDGYEDTGWIGRYLDASCPDCNPYNAIEADDTLSLALKGRNADGFAVKNPEKVYEFTRNKYFSRLNDAHKEDQLGNSNADYLYKVMRETASSADYVYSHSKIYKSNTVYPDGEFARGLKTIAELIISESATKIYYSSLSGFDTHTNQHNSQSRVLQNVSDALFAFTADLKKNDKLNEVMIFTFSEFGRRVAQNASGGTDHGTANNIMIIGGALKKNGFYNLPPDLANLIDGDLEFQIDFRNIYATFLKNWLGANDQLILGKKFESLSFV